MKYPELTGKCKKCTGCNLLEIPFFTGKEKCEVAEDKKIIEGDQISYEQISQSKNNSRWNRVR